MKIKKIISVLGLPNLTISEDFIVKGVTSNSQEVKDNFIFVAIKGKSCDGHKFINQAIKNGAKAIICEKKPGKKPNQDIPRIIVKDAAVALAKLCAEFYRHPSDQLKCVGITGTNGKTTVSYLIESLLKANHRDPAVIGTINYRFKNKIMRARTTTPGARELQSLLARAKKENVEYAVMEVSSHALDQERVHGINFSHAIFTNLTHDHLDYHKHMDDYFLAKAKLFKGMDSDAVSIINRDDAYSEELIKVTKSRVLTYGLGDNCDVRAYNIHSGVNGLSFSLEYGQKQVEIKSNLIGEYNLYNILAAIAFCLSEGISLDLIRKVIEKFKPPSGRLERVHLGLGFLVFVDYAHTPDALENVIKALKKTYNKRIIVLFGCGGGRDRKKRPLMGKVASDLADWVVVTSDNPRDESPQVIIKDIIKGMKKNNHTAIVAREKAILDALHLAKHGDIVLLAGKGHERQQLIKGRAVPFDDREIVKRFLLHKKRFPGGK